MLSTFIFAVGHGASFGWGQSPLNPAVEGAALTMLAILLGLLATIAVSMILLVRRGRKSESPETVLIREVTRPADQPVPPRPPATDSPDEPWQRPEGWWRDQG